MFYVATCPIDQDTVQYDNKKTVLSQRERRDAALNFDTYRILQRHRAVSLPQHGFLVYISDRSNADSTHSTLICTAVTQNHGDS